MAASCSSDDELEDKGKDKGKINGHEYVDLGLPSGTKWATMNVGASKPEDYGDYYAWGETETKSKYSISTYLTSIGGTMSDLISEFGTSKDPLQSYVYPNRKSIAGTDYDVAHVKWGGSWKMPTIEQIEELFIEDYCTKEWIDDFCSTGVAGIIITSKKEGYEGNFIFLPAAGYRRGSSPDNEGYYGNYWSATPNSTYAYFACGFLFNSGNVYWNDGYRCYGLSVRPVSE